MTNFKQCTKCKQIKLTDEFPKVSKTDLRPRAACKACCASGQRKIYGEKPEQYRNYVRKRRQKYEGKYRRVANLKTFGLTIQDYEQMLIQQNGQCAICGVTKCQSGRRFAIDHCHFTGRIRGLLCLRCNQAIGKLNDNYFLLQQAADYVAGLVSVGHPKRTKPDSGNGAGI